MEDRERDKAGKGRDRDRRKTTVVCDGTALSVYGFYYLSTLFNVTMF